jgi:fluoride exporter
MTLPTWLTVFLGGGVGAVMRWGVTLAALKVSPGYRGLGTLIVNVLGCLAIGYLAGAEADHRYLSERWRTFLVTGILGGLTTFSALALEITLLSRTPGLPWLGIAHLLVNVCLGVAAVVIGNMLAQRWPG